jgi:hypothetical protein
MLREDAAREPGRAPSRLARFLLLRGRIREARAIIDRSPVPTDPRARYLVQSAQVHQFLEPQMDAAGIRRITDDTSTWSQDIAAYHAHALAYVGEAERALALARLLVDEPGSTALVGALVAWRKDGAAAALPTLRRLARGDPASPESNPPEAPSWYAAECAVEASPDEAALADLRRFQRFHRPLGQLRTWAYPRSLLLEVRVLEGLGHPVEARAALARLEDLLSKADADYPLLPEARALRRKLGPSGRPVAAASDPGRPNSGEGGR